MSLEFLHLQQTDFKCDLLCVENVIILFQAQQEREVQISNSEKLTKNGGVGAK